jgi:hypothetical protein
MRLFIFYGGFMKRTPNAKSRAKSKASAVFSAGVLLSAGSQAMAQGAPKAPPPKQAAPPAPAAPKPAPAAAGSATFYTVKFASNFMKFRNELSSVGMLDGQPVFKTGKGEYFTVETGTGDLKFHSAESLGYLKIDSTDKLVAVKTNSMNGDGKLIAVKTQSWKTFLKFEGIKGESKVSVLGVDAQSHVIQQNSRGEKFYLGPNGDMVFVK